MTEAYPCLFELRPLARLNDADRSKIQKVFCERVVAPHRVLYRAGDAPPGIWLVATGFVKLVRSSPEGQELLMSLAGPGDMFGPCCDPFASTPASCTATTQTAARLLHIPSVTWKEVREREPAIAQAILAMLLASRRGCTELGPQLAFRSVESRVAALLHSLTRWARGSARPVEIPRLLTQAEMASAVGTAREVVTRCLARFEEQGIIQRRGRRILVPDPAALERVDA